jgi:anti-anti-sigma regulatory factor
MSFVYRLEEHGRTFSTRPRGVEMREALLLEAEAAEAVELDFAGVLSVSYSFADEFVGALHQAENAEELPFSISITGTSEEVSRVVERAIANRSRSEVAPTS